LDGQIDDAQASGQNAMSETQQSQWNVNLRGMVPVNVSGIADAPSDGVRYVRKDAAWVSATDETVVKRNAPVSADVVEWDAVAWSSADGYWSKAQAVSDETIACGVAVNVSAGVSADIVLAGAISGAHPYGAALGPRYLSGDTAGVLVETPPASPALTQHILHVGDASNVFVNVYGARLDAANDGKSYVRNSGEWTELVGITLYRRPVSVAVQEWDAVTWGSTDSNWRQAAATDNEFLAQGIAVNVGGNLADIVISGILVGAHPYGATLGPRYLSADTAGGLVETPPASPALTQHVLHVSDANDLVVNPTGATSVDPVGEAPNDGDQYVRKSGTWSSIAPTVLPATAAPAPEAGKGKIHVEADEKGDPRLWITEGIETARQLGHKIVAGAARWNIAGEQWEIIDDVNHTPIGVASLVTGDKSLTINYSFTAKIVRSFVVTPDEGWSELGLTAGASVGLSSAVVDFGISMEYRGFVSFNGSTWTASTTNGTITPTWQGSFLRLTHGKIPGISVAITARQSPYRPCLVSVGSTQTDVEFRDPAGVVVATPDTDMKVWFSRFHSGAAPKTAFTTLDLAENIWFYGIFD